MGKKVADKDFELEAEANAQFVEEFCTKPVFDDDGVQVSASIGMDGKEYGDPVPMAPPIGFSNPPDLMEMMRQMIRSEATQKRLDEEGWDTEEEAADFDVDDDPLPPLTFHEAILQPPPASEERPQGAPQAAPSPSTAGPHGSAAKEGGQGAGPPTAPVPAPPSDPDASTST